MLAFLNLQHAGICLGVRTRDSQPDLPAFSELAYGGSEVPRALVPDGLQLLPLWRRVFSRPKSRIRMSSIEDRRGSKTQRDICTCL